jgi:hypothetical protein
VRKSKQLSEIDLEVHCTVVESLICQLCYCELLGDLGWNEFFIFGLLSFEIFLDKLAELLEITKSSVDLPLLSQTFSVVN